MTTLRELEPGRRASVVAIEGSDEVAVRLLEMGLTPGVDVEMVGSAVWGDPLEVRVRGYALSLRKQEAARVVIEPR